MMEETNRQLALKMWEWLVTNPAKLKRHYRDYLKKNDREHEYHFCHACKEAERRALIALKDTSHDDSMAICVFCPVMWVDKAQCLCSERGYCEQYGSLYHKWKRSETYTVEDIMARKSLAIKIYELLRDGWKEQQ